MDIDGVVFEWIGLLFQQKLVLGQLKLTQPGGPLRIHQIGTEASIDMGNLVSGLGCERRKAVTGGFLVSINCPFKRIGLCSHALIQWQRQANAVIPGKRFAGENGRG